MARRPVPPRRMAGAPRAGGAASAQDAEAVGKFDKFALFALALPSLVLAIIGVVLGAGYTHKNYDIGFLGIFPGKKTIASWDSGPESVKFVKLEDPKIVGFERSGYIGDTTAGEVDVAVIDAGRAHNVHLGDVFTLTDAMDGVRLEFVVFDLTETTCRAYVLLGQDVSLTNGERKYSLAYDSVKELCGGRERDIPVKREWKDQIVRRYVEERTNQ